MNEQEAEEQGTFLKGAFGALEDLACDIEAQRLSAYVIEKRLTNLVIDTRKISKQIEDYFGRGGK